MVLCSRRHRHLICACGHGTSCLETRAISGTRLQCVAAFTARSQFRCNLDVVYEEYPAYPIKHAFKDRLAVHFKDRLLARGCLTNQSTCICPLMFSMCQRPHMGPHDVLAAPETSKFAEFGAVLSKTSHCSPFATSRSSKAISTRRTPV